MGRVIWLAAGALVLCSGAWGADSAAGCAEPAVSAVTYESAPAEGGDALTVVSINLGKETDEILIAAELRGQDELARADVLSLQEVQRDATGASVAERLARQLAMNAAVAGAGSAGGGENADAVALLSRYPLDHVVAIPLPRNELGIRSRCRVALAATVRGVRVVGLHLDTRVNVERRLEQMRPMLEAAEDFEGPVVLAGDFNTNSFWWIEHLIPVPFVNDQAGPVHEHLKELGYRTPFPLGGQATNDFLGLQLDWVFLRGLEASEWGVTPLGFSDHHAVWVVAEK